MRSSFFGLNTLLRALMAQQEALDTTNHNIANANTDGYSRQVASMAATLPYTVPAMNHPPASPLQVGTGVVVERIQRQRDAFVDLELRQQSQIQARWEALRGGLQQVEGVFTEPSDQGLQTLLTNFFNAWSELSNNPQSSAARATVRSSGDTLAAGFSDLANRLEQIRRDVDGAIAAAVPELNQLGAQLAALNGQIARAVSTGDVPNDLRDKRDLLLDQIAKEVGATYHEEANGTVTVLIGGHGFVIGDRVNAITTETRQLASGTQLHLLKWQNDAQNVTVGDGTLAGQLALRDQVLPEQLGQLDLLASTIVNAVNAQHRQGFGIGAYASQVTNFFDPMTATQTLNMTGIGDQLVSGTITVGSQTLTISPTTQTFKDVMDAIANAIATQTGGTASWTIDAATGHIVITQSSPTQVTLGANGDTSNFLQVTGLLGAVNAPSGGGRTITGLGPVTLVRAASLQLDQVIKNPDGLDAIAAAAGSSAGLAASAGPGDNRNALAIAALARTSLSVLGNATFDDFYASTIAQLGVQSREADQMAQNQQLLTQHLQQRRESISGVSLDEEATQLIRYQRAYQAAARGITTLDDLLETVINHMGRAGL